MRMLLAPRCRCVTSDRATHLWFICSRMNGQRHGLEDLVRSNQTRLSRWGHFATALVFSEETSGRLQHPESGQAGAGHVAEPE
ncbi:hypothetical protein GQ55_5G463800 [Panicum hallii var. hallii]|uniref:Uncharacterized protein n=1 Tax=Panicum hallii var. hallii TaxID=1504633 RepID=A0A2T7DQN1_9POAL|nr:hypothetical protein GQ55_5G463800 [Panicum hallii var. hallii]